MLLSWSLRVPDEGKPKGDEPTQKTPKGVEIPIPTRDAVIRDLKKVAPGVEPPANADEPDTKD